MRTCYSALSSGVRRARGKSGTNLIAADQMITVSLSHMSHKYRPICHRNENYTKISGLIIFPPETKAQSAKSR